MGWQSLSLVSPTPHSTKQKEKPLPQGLLPPQPGCTFSGSQQSYGSGAGGRGRWPIRLSWTVAVTWAYWSILGPKVCAICFSEG